MHRCGMNRTVRHKSKSARESVPTVEGLGVPSRGSNGLTMHARTRASMHAQRVRSYNARSAQPM